jgi:alpha-L-fucosidase
MKKIFLAVLLLGISRVYAQSPAPYGALPTPRQLAWQETEMYCIIHFSMATMTDKEWAYGDENPAIFNPSNFDAMQIVAAAKAGGFKGIVVVAKHHDGFCLWPTKTTDHNICKSPWKNGKGDLVKEYQDACKKLGMKMGVYLSPWDRNNVLYGSPAYVTDIYRKQLKELYANYGPLFISWHDGANGGDGYYGGKREVRKIDRSTYYGWDTTWGITRSMQPGAAIFGDAGPDVRWVGNEEGHAGETYWATFTPEAADGKIPSNGNVKYEESPTGTRNGKYWIPAECDVPSRPGWFYHPGQDGQTKSPYTLVDLYYKSVGRGACLDLGLSPDKNGHLTSEDVNDLRDFGTIIRETFATNLAKGASFKASNIRAHNPAKFGPQFLTDNNRYSYWATDDAVTKPELTIDLHKPTTFNVIRLRENIKLGQRIEGAAVDAQQNGAWKQIAEVTSIGANKLIRLPQNITASKLRLRITASPVCIALSDFGLFKEPAHLSAPVISRNHEGMVNISTEAPVSAIHFTMDGSEPDSNSPLFTGSFSFKQSGTIKAIAFESGKAGEKSIKVFGINKTGWTVKADTSIRAGKNAMRAIDDDSRTVYNTITVKPESVFQPQTITVDMGNEVTIKGFTYLPRQDKRSEGIVDRYTYEISLDEVNWLPAAEGEFSNIISNPIEQTVIFKAPQKARYFRFTAMHVTSGNGVTIAELGVF